MDKLNKILRYPEKMPCDKRMHFILGVVFVSLALSGSLTDLQANVLNVIFAWSIEFYQKYTKSGQYDDWDAIAVVLGGLTVSLSNFIQG